MIHLLAALLLNVSDPNYGPGTENYDGWPPSRFTRDRGRIHVDFLTDNKIYKACDMKPEKNYVLEACSGDISMELPNPCTYPKTDDYARIVCHELGHLNGWPDNHPK